MDSFEIAPAPQLPSGVGWQAFGDVEFIAQMLVVLAMAIGLAATIGYHPSVRRKATSLDELEQPKILIIYAMVGAVITIVVKTMPSMALVVFGIGGLLRFRTNAGEAKDTGRVILVTVVGLACGLELWVVAVLTTLLSWLLIFVLERGTIECLVVQGLESSAFNRVAQDYGQALRELGCKVIGEERRVKKGSLALIFRAPRKLDRAQIEARLAQLPDAGDQALRWEST